MKKTSTTITKDHQPDWVCKVCGNYYGKRSNYKDHISCWHTDICGVCGQYKACTEARDFGYLRQDWLNYNDK